MKTNSLELYIDEKNQRLIAIEHKGGGETESVLDLSLEELRTREPAELRHSLGRLILAFLNSRSKKGLNLPQDEEDQKRLDDEYDELLVRDSDPKNPADQYSLATHFIGRGISDNRWSDIELGEQWLNKAIAAGYPKALEYRDETWSLLKPRLEQKFKPTD